MNWPVRLLNPKADLGVCTVDYSLADLAFVPHQAVLYPSVGLHQCKVSDSPDWKLNWLDRIAKAKSICAGSLIMDVMKLHQARPDMGRRQRREADATDMEAAHAATADLYVVIGYRGPKNTVTTQQWLSMRCISF